jgi:16S rRNA (cytosine967-C5)-methyltransferase
VDAPCSGTGTLGRNPEIKWRLAEADLAGFYERQRKILANAMACVAEGGRLVYATCSLEPEENENVVEGWRVEKTMLRLPGRDPGDGFFAAMIVPR